MLHHGPIDRKGFFVVLGELRYNTKMRTQQKIKEQSAGIILLRRERGEWKCLLLRAYGRWDFPKGRREPGESLLQAAIRETKEESGIRHTRFRWGLRAWKTGVYSQGKRAYYFVAQTSQRDVVLFPNPITNLVEHDAYKWATLEEAEALVTARLHGVFPWLRNMLGLELTQKPTNRLADDLAP